MNRWKLDYKWLVGIVYIMALFMDLLDMTITNVAIPTLAEEFGATTTIIEWVITGYLLSLALFIPISGWLGDRFGTKLVFACALTTFTAGSLLCGAAWNVESLIAFRIFQGIGGGMLTPVGMTMLFRAFPPSERAAASAVLAIPAMVAPALGPILGGYLVDFQSWRWIFFINIPFGAIALLATLMFIREEQQESAGKLDLPGFILGGAGMVAVVYALAQAGQHGFNDSQVQLIGFAGVALVAAFTIVELKSAEPMLDLRLLGDKLFGASNIVLLLGNASIMGSFFLIPIFLQTQKGLSPFDTGLITFPLAIGVAITAQPAAKIYSRVGPRRMMIVAFAGNMVLTCALALVGYDTSGWLIAASMFVRGMFFGFMMVPMQAATFATISPEATGRASSIFSVSRQIAASLGVAVLATVLTSRLAYHDAALGDAASRGAALAAFHDAFLVAGALSILGILGCFLIDDRKAVGAGAHEVDFSGELVPVEAAGG
jgi:EmrB/QacA subfamily drug resistance transporter